MLAFVAVHHAKLQVTPLNFDSIETSCPAKFGWGHRCQDAAQEVWETGLLSVIFCIFWLNLAALGSGTGVWQTAQ